MYNISFYGSHNASYVVEKDKEILLVLEIERFLNYKNSGMAQYACPNMKNLLFFSKMIPEFIMEYLEIDEFENCYFLNCDVILNEYYQLEKNIKAKNYIEGHHHRSHAAGVFYQSPYPEALIFSFDGGGDDGKFNIYLANRENSVTLLETVINPTLNLHYIGYDLGFPYMIFGNYLKDIRYEHISTGNLVYSGKIMGLASYGKVNKEWLPHFIEFYKSNPHGGRVNGWEKDSYYHFETGIYKLGQEIGIEFNEENRLEDQVAYDVAATSQRAFEECFLEVALPYMKKYPDLPICITGGCGLNILLNTRLIEEFNKEIFIGPDPNDCGIALGMMLDVIRPKSPIDTTYSGTNLLDINMLGDYLQNEYDHFKADILDTDKLVDDLYEGKIVGVARGRSEHGPRALGNRSIICNPSIPDMKDILNEKVKHREWYRPFAPVVRLEDVNKYFEWDKESRWMSFCPKVKEEWREKLAAVTHIDGTARVQTITRDQNTWLYDLLTKFEEKSGVGVLLNTSFNVDGKPILSSIKDAFTILEKTQLDCLVIENYYIQK